MKLNYDSILKNIESFDEFTKLSVFKKWKSGIYSKQSLSALGLSDFVDFCEFREKSELRGFELVKPIKWRELKKILIDNTNNERYKKYLSNRTQNQFNKILSQGNIFDKLINGRIIRRTRRFVTRRSDQKIDGLSSCIIPLINYIISNEIEVYDRFWDDISRECIWYRRAVLDTDSIMRREIEISDKFIEHIARILEESDVDFRKLNVSFIRNLISDKLIKLSTIPAGTTLKSLRDVKSGWLSKFIVQAGKYYRVNHSSIDSNGYLVVSIISDLGSTVTFPYSYFEDLSVCREEILNNLLGE